MHAEAIRTSLEVSEQALNRFKFPQLPSARLYGDKLASGQVSPAASRRNPLRRQVSNSDLFTSLPDGGFAYSPAHSPSLQHSRQSTSSYGTSSAPVTPPPQSPASARVFFGSAPSSPVQDRKIKRKPSPLDTPFATGLGQRPSPPRHLGDIGRSSSSPNLGGGGDGGLLVPIRPPRRIAPAHQTATPPMSMVSESSDDDSATVEAHDGGGPSSLRRTDTGSSSIRTIRALATPHEDQNVPAPSSDVSSRRSSFADSTRPSLSSSRPSVRFGDRPGTPGRSRSSSYNVTPPQPLPYSADSGRSTPANADGGAARHAQILASPGSMTALLAAKLRDSPIRTGIESPSRVAILAELTL